MTFGSGGRRSIQLSYRRVADGLADKKHNRPGNGTEPTHVTRRDPELTGTSRRGRGMGCLDATRAVGRGDLRPRRRSARHRPSPHSCVLPGASSRARLHGRVFTRAASQPRLHRRVFTRAASHAPLHTRRFTRAASHARLRSHGFTGAASQTRLRRHGFADTASQTRLRRHGFADTASQTRLHRHGFTDTASHIPLRSHSTPETVLQRRRAHSRNTAGAALLARYRRRKPAGCGDAVLINCPIGEPCRSVTHSC